MARLPRLLSLALLFSSRRRMRAEDAAEQFGVSVRTVYRDIAALEEAGFPIVGTPGDGYHLGSGAHLKPLAVTEDRYFGFQSDASDSAADCARVHQRLVNEGGIDLCLLGLGLNGHIAMNEPAPALQPFAHAAKLSEESQQHPMLSKSGSRPTHGITIGMADILGAREVLLLVSGAAKRAALQRLLRREITTDFPASFLWLHPNWTLLCDREAAAGLALNS